MKLAACYSIYNGLELLESSIIQIINHVDLLIIGYQTTSNKFQVDNKSEILALELKIKYNAVIFKFEPDHKLNTKDNELIKHNMLLNAARNENCTHFFMSATDHFYDSESFKQQSEFIMNSNYECSFTSMYTYYKHPTWQLTPIESYYMPFIMRIKPTTKFEKTSNYPVLVDPSLKINTYKMSFLFPRYMFIMHHYSMVRFDILSKFKNAAASIRWNEAMRNTFINEHNNYDINVNPGLVYFQGRKIQQVPDYFNLSKLFSPE